MMRSLLTLALLATAVAHADVHEGLNRFYNKLGGSANVTSAEVYQGQKAGYATGGGVTIRSRVVDTKPIAVSLPKIDAGCGGIDIYAGGFSYLNRQQLVDTLKGIGSSALGYSFLLGLETVSPQVANTIKQLQTWSNTINSVGINSCETASQLTGALWPQRTMASQQICRTVGGQTGRFADYVAARHGCAQASDYQQVSETMRTDPRYQHVLPDAYNIAWEAIQKQSLLRQDKELAELFMTLVGTVVVGEGDTPKIFTFPSKIDDESFLHVLLEGGSTTIYTCGGGSQDSKRCLTIHEDKLEIQPQKAWISRIRNQLLAMQTKILSDQELNESEQVLLSGSRLPLYKIVNVLTAYKRGHCPIDLYQVADLVAMDLLAKYLQEVIDHVREGAVQLKNGQLYADAVNDYLEELSRVERTVRHYEVRAMHQMEREYQLLNRLQLIERKLAAEIVL